jgi:hypothetical protein
MMPNNWVMTLYMRKGHEKIGETVREIMGVGEDVPLEAFDKGNPRFWPGMRDILP